MKSVMKYMTMAGLGVATMGGMYLMVSKDTRKKTGKTMVKAMNSAEDLITKNMN